MALMFLGSAASFVFFDAGGSKGTDAWLGSGFFAGAAYGLHLDRAVGLNGGRAYVKAQRAGGSWGHFIEILYPPVRGFSKE